MPKHKSAIMHELSGVMGRKRARLVKKVDAFWELRRLPE
jgi:hypothetical protein